MELKSEKEVFNIVKRARSFNHALRGIGIFIKSTRNAWIHFAVGFLVVTAGFYFSLNTYEWIAIIFAIGLVIVAEAFNTAIEIDMDLTSPEFHPYARDTKDVAAGAVLFATLTAIIIGLVVFVPKIY
jgi:diacylglycerol kinase